MNTHPSRHIVSRHTGHRTGPIQRLIDPLELGQQLKPFVFLDYFNAPVKAGFGFGMHPHSGLATLTWQPHSDIQYEDTTGQKGLLQAGGLEWMNAGGGAWHQGRFVHDGMATGFQLWVPMPPSVEDAEPTGVYVPPAEVPCAGADWGTLRVLLGHVALGGREWTSPLHSFQDINCFVLELRPGCTWTYQPPAHHSVAWAFVFDAPAMVAGETTQEQLLVLSETGSVHFQALGDRCRILVGSALPHVHPLVLGASSIHTNEESLRRAQVRIRTQGMKLRSEGRL